MDPSIIDLLHEHGLIDDEQKELLLELSQLPAEDLTALRDRLVSAARAVDPKTVTEEEYEQLTAAVSAVEAIGKEFTRRSGDRDRRAATVAKLVASLTAAAEVAPPPDTPRLPSISRLASRTPRANRPRATQSRGAARLLTASGEATTDDLVELVSRGMARAVREARAHDGPPGRIQLATLKVDYPAERILDSDEVLNGERIAAVTSPRALVASGGICAPVAVDYSLSTIAQADRPVRDSLAQFGASRGGVRYTLPHTLAQVSTDGPATLWTQANDIALNNPATKPHATFACQAVQETLVDAVTSIVQFGNFQARYAPEQIAEYLTTVDAVHARLAEATLLKAMFDGSTQVTADIDLLGAARDFLATIDRAAAQYRYRHRMAEDSPLRLLYPEWLEDMIRVDLVRQLPGDSGGGIERLATADAEIDRWWSARNINASTCLDSPTGATPLQGWGVQGAGPMLPWVEKVICFLFHEGAWMFLDGGELNLGMVRDSTLNKTNDFQMFSEVFEKAVFRGHESLAITCDICPSGATAGTVSTLGICASGS